MALVRGRFAAGTAQARPWDAPGIVAEDSEYLTVRFHYRLSLVGCPVRAPVGLQKRHASLGTAVAGRRHTGRDARADSGDCGRTGDDSVGVWRH